MNQAPRRVRKNLWTAAFLLLVFCAVLLGFGGRRLGSALIRHQVARAMERWAISPALRWLEWGVWLDSDDGEWYMMRAKCFRLLDRMDQWQKSLESAKAEGISSDWIEAEMQIGSIASGHVPDNAPAIRHLFVAAGLPKDDISAAIVRGCLASGNYQGARKLLLQWERESTADPHVVYMWGVYREALRERDEAVQKLEQVLREEAEHVQAAFVETVCNALQVVLSGPSADKMPKAADRVERGVDLPGQPEIGHVTDEGGCGKPIAFQAAIAVVDRTGIQVQTRDFVSGLRQTVHQSSGSASGLEHAADFAPGQVLETGNQEIKFCFPVRAVNQIVVLGIVVKARLDDLGHDVEKPGRRAR